MKHVQAWGSSLLAFKSWAFKGMPLQAGPLFLERLKSSKGSAGGKSWEKITQAFVFSYCLFSIPAVTFLSPLPPWAAPGAACLLLQCSRASLSSSGFVLK